MNRSIPLCPRCKVKTRLDELTKQGSPFLRLVP